MKFRCWRSWIFIFDRILSWYFVVPDDFCLQWISYGRTFTLATSKQAALSKVVFFIKSIKSVIKKYLKALDLAWRYNFHYGDGKFSDVSFYMRMT